jgi:glycolate oxidase FAD binding subunit
MPFAGDERVIWRISTAPSRGHEIAAAIGEGEYFYDWAGGLIWLALGSLHDGGAARVRSALAGDGHATLIRAPAGLRASVAVFEPQTQGLAALTRRVKESFDPKGVLGPGRMVAGV